MSQSSGRAAYDDPKIIPFPLRPSRATPRAKAKSQYDLYPLPFFDKKQLSPWAIKPTGRYGDDFETGYVFAREFLQSNDGTAGWRTLLAHIVSEMIARGPDGAWADGKPKTNGVVIGFMNGISEALIMAKFGAGPPRAA